MERALYPVINSLSALHSLEHPENFRELHREEKEKGDRGDQQEKIRSDQSLSCVRLFATP